MSHDRGRPQTPPSDPPHHHGPGHSHAHSGSIPSLGHSRNFSLDSQNHFPSPIRIENDYDIKHNLNDSPQQDAQSRNEGGDSPLRTNGTASTMLSPTSATFSATSPGSQWSPWTPTTPQTGGIDGAFQPLEPANNFTLPNRNPFNFTTQQYVGGPSAAAKTVANRSSAENLPGKRRGHKYRHSSIHTSHQIFQPPAPRAPLSVPASLPMPTRNETWASITPHQTLRLAWCMCHFLASAYVQFSSYGSLSMTALSRLLLFDAAGATCCVAVDVMSNFEVWQRGSLKHPFGLERADVLAGFAMAVFLGFMGLDVLSHGAQHALENLGDHVPHAAHAHARAGAGSVDLDCALAVVVTLISALGLRNHARIGRATRLPWLANFGGRILGNPSHFLTLSCSTLLLFLPLFGAQTYTVVDTCFSFVVALLMITLGARLGTALASPLLLSYTHPTNPSATREFLADLAADPGVSSVEEAKIWQVHYGLCVANFKLRYRGGGAMDGYGVGDEAARIRARVASLLRSRLGGVYGVGGRGPRWDVSMQIAIEQD